METFYFFCLEIWRPLLLLNIRIFIIVWVELISSPGYRGKLVYEYKQMEAKDTETSDSDQNPGLVNTHTVLDLWETQLSASLL